MERYLENTTKRKVELILHGLKLGVSETYEDMKENQSDQPLIIALDTQRRSQESLIQTFKKVVNKI
jgi:hypothetical protein